MTRGPRAEASRAAARRSVCALALMCDEVLTLIGHHTTDTHVWLASWQTGRVGAPPWPWSQPARSLLGALHDARLDVWRHVTHERNARARVMVRAVAVLREHRHTEADPLAWCEASYQRHHAAMQRAEIAARGGVQ